jgi:hypothetical protein
MDNVERMKRHLAKSIPIVLKNENGEEDTFMFKPLNVEQQAILMELSKRMSGREKIKIKGIEVPDLNKEDMNDMFDLMLDITKFSLGEIEESILLDFVNNNFEELSDRLIDLVPKRSDSDALAKIKKRQEEIRNAAK